MGKFSTLALSVAVALSLTACIDTGSSDDENNDDGTSTGVSGSAHYEAEESGSYNGITFVYKLGADGILIAYDSAYGPMLKFQDSTRQTATIVSMSQVESVSGNDSVAGTFSATITSNYQTGEQHIVGQSSVYGAVDCVNTYETLLPLQIYADPYDGEVVLPYIDDRPLISSTCPSWINNSNSTTTGFQWSSVATFSTAEDSGVVTNVYEYESES